MNAAVNIPAAPDVRPLIAHIVFRFDYGGLENGVVNLLNGLSESEFRHVVIALTEASDFRHRIRRGDIQVLELRKRPGKDFGAYVRLWRMLRGLRPRIVHTRNVGTIDCAFVALLAGVPVRVHGEHGWDMHDPDGSSPRYLAVRRIFGRFVHRFVSVSREIEQWLVARVRIPQTLVTRICNGVDVAKFTPAGARRLPVEARARFPDSCVIVGSVTRFTEIKDPLNLVRAFVAARQELGADGPDLRLLMAGDGPLREAALKLLREQGLEHVAWLPGSRDDVNELMASMDVFVLGSRREGISNTVLEAMASGRPVIATATGGNVELVESGATGELVPPMDSTALSAALVRYARDEGLRARHGAEARRRAELEYSLDGMMRRYGDLYRALCAPSGAAG